MNKTIEIINDDTERKNRVTYDLFFDNLVHDTADTWHDDNGNMRASGKFIAWLRVQDKMYKRYLRLIDYDTGAFDAWLDATGNHVSGDTATEAEELLRLARKYHVEMRKGDKR